MTTDVKKFQLEPHGWKAVVTGVNQDQDNVAECTGHISPLDEQEKTALLEQLAESAYLVYKLAEQQPLSSGALEPFIRYATDVQVTCTCGSEACQHVVTAKAAAASWAVKEPLALLSALGITRSALLEGVFGSWAQEAADAAVPQAALLQRPAARPGGNISAIMDYIAESVKDSALHKPGDELDEIELCLKAPAKLESPPDLTSILPQAPVHAALSHLQEQMSRRAAEWSPLVKSGSKSK